MSEHKHECGAYWEAHGETITAAHARLWHWHAKQNHPAGCRCRFCASDGAEQCSEDKPCGTCRKDAR